MIFDVLKNFGETESYKERNLYYKIFAGCLFNELLPGYTKRKQGFVELLHNIISETDRFRGDREYTIQLLNQLRGQNINVTFDFHSAQLIDEHKKENRGEMSDVLLQSESIMVSIECKFLEDMKFGKDVEEVQARIDVVARKLNKQPLQVLLMNEDKWK